MIIGQAACRGDSLGETRMKRFSSLTAAASLAGLVMISSGPALAFDGHAIPPMLVASPTLPLSACLYAEKAGYPNPGGDGCSYLRRWSSPYYYNMVESGALMSGRSVAIGQMGMTCATAVTVCQTSPRLVCRRRLLLQDGGRPRAGHRNAVISPARKRPSTKPRPGQNSAAF